MKALVWYAIGLALLASAAPAQAESRSVLILIEHKKDGKPQVTIRSDEEKDRRRAGSLDDASTALKAMQGWGSIVHVFIVSDQPLEAADSKKLRQAVADNSWLELAYLREGREVAHRGDRLAKSFADHYLKTQGIEAVEETEKAKEVPPVKDDASGISVAVQADGKTLVAKDKDGKVVWQADVIKRAGEPGVGKPAIRHLSIKEGRAVAVYGKHSFAEFDLRTGKLVSKGSD
jgi:hypothetical protein